MEKDQELKEILKEVSSAISKSLSTPETLERLEQLQKKGYQLYLVMEPTTSEVRKKGSAPVMPIHVHMNDEQMAPSKTKTFSLSDDDKDFLRTLKIKVD